jgi:hypothetical protein
VTIKEIPINAIDASENSGENCSASEPFALRILDSSMSPEFDNRSYNYCRSKYYSKNMVILYYMKLSNSLIIKEN